MYKNDVALELMKQHTVLLWGLKVHIWDLFKVPSYAFRVIYPLLEDIYQGLDSL